jgi:DNA-binding Lrp family transcriptional regulator
MRGEVTDAALRVSAFSGALATVFITKGRPMPNFVELDAFDHRLLARMRKNNLEPARITAAKVGLSESAVLRRLRRLRAEGVISSDVAVVDPARVEPRILIHVLTEMNTQDQKKYEAFYKALKASPEVQGAWNVTGETDFLITVAVRTMVDFEAFILRELSHEAGVKNFKSMIVIREVVGFDPSRAVLSR